jgi:hypothetical protein
MLVVRRHYPSRIKRAARSGPREGIAKSGLVA